MCIVRVLWESSMSIVGRGKKVVHLKLLWRKKCRRSLQFKPPSKKKTFHCKKKKNYKQKKSKEKSSVVRCLFRVHECVETRKKERHTNNANSEYNHNNKTHRREWKTKIHFEIQEYGNRLYGIQLTIAPKKKSNTKQFIRNASISARNPGGRLSMKHRKWWRDVIQYVKFTRSSTRKILDRKVRKITIQPAAKATHTNIQFTKQKS